MTERAQIPIDAQLRRELGLLCEEEIAALASVDLRTVQNWRGQRSGPPCAKFGKRWLYRVDAFQKWLSEQERETQA